MSQTTAATRTGALWAPVQVGELTLPPRLAMAPTTRGRSGPDGTPTALTAEHHAQRASSALIVTEGTQPTPRAGGSSSS